LSVAGLIGAGTAPALSQSNCAAREKILNTLNQEYKEAPAGLGLTQAGSVVELLVSRAGSWTLLATAPNGMSCLLAAGDHWEGIPIALGQKATF
jgi:hypothetical protein